MGNITKIHWYNEIGYINLENSSTFSLDEVQTYVLSKLLKKPFNFEEYLSEIMDEIDLDDYDEAARILKDIVFDLNQLFDVNQVFLSKDDIKITGEKGKCYPYSLVIHLSNKCCLGCKHCYKESKPDGIDLKYANIAEFVNFVKGKTGSITLTGGEPLLYPRLADFIDDFSNDFSIHLTTSGYAENPLTVEQIKKLETIQFTLYGSDDAGYEDFTSAKEPFEKVEEVMKLYSESNSNFTVAYQIRSDDLSEVEKIVQYCIKNKINSLKLGELFNKGKATKNFDFATYNTLDIESMVSELNQLYEKDIEIVKDNELVNMSDGKGFYTCGAGKININLLEDGSFVPCGLFCNKSFIMGNVYDKDYMEMFENHEHYLNFETFWNENLSDEEKSNLGLICEKAYKFDIREESCERYDE